jgi:WD40 repeat protein
MKMINTTVDQAQFDKDIRIHQLSMMDSAIRLSTPILMIDPGLIKGQLVGRLIGRREPMIENFLNTIYQDVRQPWMCPEIPENPQAGGQIEGSLSAHARIVTSLAVTPDGNKVISASGREGDDRQIHVWSLLKRRLLQTFIGPSTSILCLAISADGKKLASGGDDGQIILWDLVSGRMEASIQTEVGWRMALSFNHAATTIAASGPGGRIDIWDIASRRKQKTLTGHRRSVASLTFSADDKFLFSAGEDGLILVWDFPSGKCFRKKDLRCKQDVRIAISPDGKSVFAAVSDGRILRWDFEKNKIKYSLSDEPAGMHAIALSQDGKWFVTGSGDGRLRIRDTENGLPQTILEYQKGWVFALAITPDGNRILSGDGLSIRIWNPQAVSARTVLQFESRICEFILLSDRQTLLCADEDNQIVRMDLRTGQVTGKIVGHQDLVKQLLADEKNGLLFSLNQGERDIVINIWALQSLTGMYCIKFKNGYYSSVRMFKNAFGVHLRIVAAEEIGIKQLSNLQGEIVTKHQDWKIEKRRDLSIEKDEENISIATDVSRRYWRRKQGGFVIRDNDGRMLASCGMDLGRVNDISETGISEEILVGWEDGKINLWRWRDGIIKQSFIGDASPVYLSPVSEENDRFISRTGGVSSNGELLLWEMSTGKRLASWRMEKGVGVYSIEPIGSNYQQAVMLDTEGVLHCFRIRERHKIPSDLSEKRTESDLPEWLERLRGSETAFEKEEPK